MFLKPDGIVCDLCGAGSRGDFTYYSIDCQQLGYVKNRLGGDQPTVFSLDCCQACLDTLQKAIKANYTPTSVAVNCDLCAAKPRGNFTAYRCQVMRVAVSMRRGAIECKQCRKAMAPGQACACGSTSGERVAAQERDGDFLQFVACAKDYEQLAAAAVRIRTVASTLAKEAADATTAH